MVSIDSAKFSPHAAYILVICDFTSRQGLVDLLKERPQAKEKLQHALKDIKKDDPRDTVDLFIPFEGEGGMRALLVRSKAKPFLVHTEARKLFTPFFLNDADRVIQCVMLGLHELEAAHALDVMVSLPLLARHRVPTFGKKKKEEKELRSLTLRIEHPLSAKLFAQTVKRATVLSLATNQVRFLSDLPGNELTPGKYRDRLEEIAANHGLDFDFIDRKELRKRGAGAFLAVIAADPETDAGIVVLKTRNNSKRKVSIVGKGLCYDTGGYSVKSSAGMFGMHQDMAGSATAVATLIALKELEANVQAEAYLAIAENLISPTAYKPNDIVIAANGTSIEVVDTDAEGRMVLSDTLVFATENRPDLCIDFATLTGAAVRAVDTRRSVVFSTQEALAAKAVVIGDDCGERVWSFPMGDDYEDAIKSDFADVRQCATTNAADHIYAATFLSKFVKEGTPWLHVDLASAENKGGLGLVGTTTTGFGVRLAVNLIEQWEQ